MYAIRSYYGAAICTALALNVYRDRQEAIDHMVRRRDTFSPIEENVVLYNRINEDVYRDIIPTTEDLLMRSHRIFIK